MGNLARTSGEAGGSKGKQALLALLGLAIAGGVFLGLVNSMEPTPPTNPTAYTIGFRGNVSGIGWVHGEITPADFGISITCEWKGDQGGYSIKTTTTLNGLFTCADADVAWWSDSGMTISAWVTGFSDPGSVDTIRFQQ